MAFINRLKHGMDLTKFKADQLVRINQVQTEINERRDRIGSIHRQLAAAAIDLHRRGALSNPELTELCQAIDGLNRVIAEKESLIAAIRVEPAPQYLEPAAPIPANPCRSCGSGIPAGAEFCPNCGLSIPQTISSSTPEE